MTCLPLVLFLILLVSFCGTIAFIKVHKTFRQLPQPLGRGFTRKLMKTNQKELIQEPLTTRLATLGQSLRTYRINKRMTHQEVANICGFSRQTLSRIEKGDPSVAVGQLVRYAQLLEVPELFSLKPSSKTSESAKRVRHTFAEIGIKHFATVS